MKYFGLFFLIFSCSQVKLKDDFVKVQRLGITQDEYKRADFYMPEFAKKMDTTRKAQRSIASVNENTEELSNRHIYFLSLYSQYKKLGKMIGKSEDLYSCPSFHQTLLENEDVNISSSQLSSYNLEFKNYFIESENMALYPVLALPHESNSDLYSAIKGDEENAKKYLGESLSLLHKSTQHELEKLCDTGSSDGYYVYENLVRFFNNRDVMGGGTHPLTALLKIPALGNILIMDSLAQNNLSQYENLMLKRANSMWFKNYLSMMSSKREQLSRIMDNSKDTVLSLNR